MLCEESQHSNVDENNGLYIEVFPVKTLKMHKFW